MQRELESDQAWRNRNDYRAAGSNFALALPPPGPARSRLVVYTSHLAFLDRMVARIRLENNARLSRAEVFAILVHVLLAADLAPERVVSEEALVELLHERVSADRREPRARGEERTEGAAETVNLRLPSDQLARLDLFLAEARGRAGSFLGRSGALRALITWLAELNIGIHGIRTGRDLERRLMRMVTRPLDGTMSESEPPLQPELEAGVPASLADPAGETNGLKFGELLRRMRISRGLPLRFFAARVGVSAAYLSLVERGRMAPPSVEISTRMAQVLETDVDRFLSCAGRIAPDVMTIILQRPAEMSRVIRRAVRWSEEDWARLELDELL